MPKGGGIFVTAGYRRGPAFPGGDFWSVQNRWIQTEVRKISASRNIFLKRFLHVFTRFHDLIFYHFCIIFANWFFNLCLFTTHLKKNCRGFIEMLSIPLRPWNSAVRNGPLVHHRFCWRIAIWLPSFWVAQLVHGRWGMGSSSLIRVDLVWLAFFQYSHGFW